MIPSIGYIGPGAGFAFLGSFLIMLTAIGLVILSLLSWPFRALASVFFRRGKKRAKTKTRRVVVVGLDGLDPRHYRRLSTEGRLPNLKSLEDEGTFSELQSSCPSISPVAWSCFSTGANPGKHNIFDFLNRNLSTYLPELSSVRIGTGKDGKPLIQRLRKSKPFWHVLGEYGVFSTVLRVPITFPPEKFNGLSLSAMCIPDLRGTQGTFTYYASGSTADGEATGGLRIKVERKGNSIATHMPGPEIEGDELNADVLIKDITADSATMEIFGKATPLKQGEYTPWVQIDFKAGHFKKVSGLCRFCLISTEPEFRLYVTPINIDPEKPAFPISTPPYYSIYLSKLLGPFSTLGLAEDTWGLNEGAMNERQFLDQVYEIHKEREKMFFSALRRTKKGMCACVFDASDRIQHMFPHPQEGEGEPLDNFKSFEKHPLDDMYERMDDFVGRVKKKLGKRDVMMVISDHGFTVFKRGMNLNTWLLENGYLTLKNGKSDKGYLQDIDWEKTKAYTFGLTGIYINKKGRESKGIVPGSETRALKAELISKLKGLKDKEKDTIGIQEVYDAEEVYTGPHKDNGADLVIGYSRGYRASWEAAIGKVEDSVFTDNPKHWSGDHCVDYKLVPGVFFCNRKTKENGELRLMDVGPTILKLYGVPIPGYMDGKPADVDPVI